MTKKIPDHLNMANLKPNCIVQINGTHFNVKKVVGRNVYLKAKRGQEEYGNIVDVAVIQKIVKDNFGFPLEDPHE